MTIVQKIAGVINTVKGAFAALNTTMLANPIVLIIAAIAALVAAFIYLWNNCDGFRQFWIDLWENVKQVAVTVWEAIKSFLSTALEAIKTTATTVFGAIKSFFTTIWDGIKLQKNMEQVNLNGNNRIVFCGNYIDYGDSSYYVLKYLWDLQKNMVQKKLWFLRVTMSKCFWIGLRITETYIQMILSNHEKLIWWIQQMPLYFETKSQIFVHAGVDEEAGEYWMWGASDNTLLGKFPATKGKFYKTIIAGHVGTCSRDLAADRSYHDVYYDGESHYYIDGSVYKGGKLLLLAYDEEKEKYYQVENGRMVFVKPTGI